MGLGRRSDNLASVSPKKPLRSKLASSVSRSAAALSRATGRGDGAVIGGKIGLMIDPNLLANLAVGREIALISGTNGKTTTTRLTAAALGVRGEVATNSFGANMPTGHTSALAKAGNTPYAVLEVDEHYMPQVMAATSPKVVALLNLSRDQLDRAKEVAMMAQLWRDTLAKHRVHVVANADDPMITWAANSALTAGGTVTWVAAGQRWHDDSWVCPECGSHIERGNTPAPVAPTAATRGSLTPTPATPAPPIPMAVTPVAEPPVAVVPSPSAGFDDMTMLMSMLPPDAVPTEVAVETDIVEPLSDEAAAEVAAGGARDETRVLPAEPTGPEPTPIVSARTELPSDSTQTFSLSDIEDALGNATDPWADETDDDDLAALAALNPARRPAAPMNDPEPVPFGAAARAVAAAERAADLPGDSDGSDDWHCTGCDLRRPEPTWLVDGNAIIDPSGKRHIVRLQLPGRVNRANAATALAVAAEFGVDPELAVPRLASVASIAGRYAQVDRDGRNIRLLLAKNPAGWLEAFDMAENAPTLLSINSRDPDGLDTSWLFDVDFSPLQGRTVLISGERAFDLAVRLEVNDIAFTHVRTFPEAIAAVPSGRLEVIANYTAFQDIRAELDRVN